MRCYKTKKFSYLKWILVISAVFYLFADYYQRKQGKSNIHDNAPSKVTAEKRGVSEKKTNKEKLDTGPKAEKDTSSPEDLDREQRVRKLRLKNFCGNFKNYTTKTSPEKQVYLSSKYNFTLCHVPKIATTFLALVFGVIEFDNYDLQAKSRQIIQGETFQFSVLLDSTTAHEKRTIVISRDPYSRLFSAFIDKSYLPGTYYINRMMMNRKSRKLKIPSKCFDITFQDFLEFIIKEHSRGEILDYHWMPVTTSCRPCEIQPFLVLKQETFERDIWYALRNVGVEEQKLQGIDRLSKKWKNDLSIPVVIKAINFTRDTECFTWTDTAKRVWNALKMQGYIHTDEEFPMDKLKANNMIGNDDYLIEVVLETIKNRPLTSKERSEQRRQALVDAYKIVEPDTLKSIQELYMQDFELFGYSLEPPK